MRGSARRASDTEALARAEAAAERVARALGHRFEDVTLLERALTHRSAGTPNNERLEFLGDAILNFLVADALYADAPDASEGRLTRLRAQLVRRETLASIARELRLGAALRLGSGELKSGGRDRDSILADATEALIGAVYLDSDLDRCRAVVEALLGARRHEATAGQARKDPKTALQELLQSKGRPLPEYEVVEVRGAAHAQSFVVICRVTGLPAPTRGDGSSRRKAEQEAARAALAQIAKGPLDG